MTDNKHIKVRMIDKKVDLESRSAILSFDVSYKDIQWRKAIKITAHQDVTIEKIREKLQEEVKKDLQIQKTVARLEPLSTEFTLYE